MLIAMLGGRHDGDCLKETGTHSFLPDVSPILPFAESTIVYYAFG